MRTAAKTIGALAGAAVLIAAPAAMASGSGKVTVGGVDTVGTNAATGTNVGDLTFMSDAAVPMDCTSSSITGSVNRGTTVANGNVIGQISNLSFTGCTATDLLFPVSVSSKGTWNIQVVGNPAPKSTSVNILITGVTAQVKSTGAAPHSCDFQATGSVPGTFNVTTQRITIASSSFPLALQAFNGAGTKTPAASSCAGEVVTGDAANMNGVFSLSVTGGSLTF